MEIDVAPLQATQKRSWTLHGQKEPFQAGVECIGKNPGEQSLCQRKPIPHREANLREYMGLACGSTRKRLTPFPFIIVLCDVL